MCLEYTHDSWHGQCFHHKFDALSSPHWTSCTRSHNSKKFKFGPSRFCQQTQAFVQYLSEVNTKHKDHPMGKLFFWVINQNIPIDRMTPSHLLVFETWNVQHLSSRTQKLETYCTWNILHLLSRVDSNLKSKVLTCLWQIRVWKCARFPCCWRRPERWNRGWMPESRCSHTCKRRAGINQVVTDSRTRLQVIVKLDFQVENQPRAAYIGRTALVPICQYPSQKMSQLKFSMGRAGNSDNLLSGPGNVQVENFLWVG